MSRQMRELARARGPLLGVAGFVVLALTATLMVAGTLARTQEGDTIEVSAVFRDATGVRSGDDVRMAGVRIGRVVDTRLGDGAEAGTAVVTIEISADQELHDDVEMAVDYLNLMGQRYIAVSRPTAKRTAGRLADGDRVPVDRTRPALDLSAMFNAFRPVFDLLQPGDVNVLATNIVQVLQGQGPTIEHLVEQTADLTEGLVERDEVFARVVDNLDVVLAATNDHRGEIEDLLDGFGALAAGLAADRDRIGTSLDALTRLSRTADGLVGDVAPHLTADVGLARDFAAHLAARRRLLGDTAEAVPQQLATYLRTLGYGSYLNVYVCTLDIRVAGLPLSVDAGIGSQHAERCR